MDCKQAAAVKQITPETGLTRQQAEELAAKGYANRQAGDITKSTGRIILENVFTWFNMFNLAIAVCIAAVGAYKNLLYMGVIILNVLIGIVQEIRSKRVVEKLSLISAPHASVIRDGQLFEIRTEELVLSDLIQLKLGNQICADAQVLSGEIEVDESLLTGEAEPVCKSAGDFLFSGSFVVSGSCRAQIIHVGADNYAAKIASEAKKYKKVNSSLMQSLNKIVKFTSFFVIPLGILLFVNSMLVLQEGLPEAVTSTAGALLGMMPKGLVLLTSVSLAVGVIKLASKKTLVQELFCIETLSRVDTLCLDKTGTLTEGKMAVSEVIELDAGRLPIGLEEAVGCFVGAMEDENATFSALRARFPVSRNWPVCATTPFSSARKWSSASFQTIGTILFGAPEFLMKGQDFTLPKRAEQAVENGARLLLMAWSPEEVRGILPDKRVPVAAFVLKDPVRSDAKETLDFFRAQDVELKIISGDNPVTVSSIAKQAGLERYENYVDVSALKDETALKAAAEQYTIFGRVSPEQKRTLVHALQEKGHTVAMTGDGVNDVLALKDADCSIAMAAGSDAARQVAQLVLMDSNFSALPSVVMEGRRVVNNITRTASLFLVKTVFSFLLSILTAFCGMSYPLDPLHLTLIGVVAEGIPSFFLALEPNRERVKGNFLQTVLSRAIPSAVLIVLYLMLLNLIAPHLQMTELEITTLGVYLTGFIWLMQLFDVCRPFDKMRAVLWGLMTAAFFCAAFFFRGFFELGTLTLPSFAIFAVLAALCYPLQKLLERAVRAFYRAKEQKKRRQRA